MRNFFFPESKISPIPHKLSDSLWIYIIFLSIEQIKKYPDSPDTFGRKPYPKRKETRI